MTDQWTGGEATALRKALRLTVEGFATRLGVAPRTVANWAATPDMTPRLSVQDLLDGMLADASANARARFEELTDSSRRPAGDQADEVTALRETVANLSARISLLERLVAGPTHMEVGIR